MSENVQVDIEMCHKVNVIVGAHIEAQMPHDHYEDYKWVKDASGQMVRRLRTPAEIGELLREKCRDFEEFLRDHRSQDMISLDVVLERRDQCSVCEEEWEPVPGEDGTTVCACCGTIVEGRP